MITINGKTKMEKNVFNKKWIFTVELENKDDNFIELYVVVEKNEVPFIFAPKIIGKHLCCESTECEVISGFKKLLTYGIENNIHRDNLNIVMKKVPKYVRVALVKYLELLLFLLENKIGGNHEM
ncbi:MAG: hypothetical protein ACRCX8_20120 [Sarcina sp.]